MEAAIKSNKNCLFFESPIVLPMLMYSYALHTVFQRMLNWNDD